MLLTESYSIWSPIRETKFLSIILLIFHQACVHMTKAPSTDKRAKREHASHLLKEALMKGKWLWYVLFWKLGLLNKFFSDIGNAQVLSSMA